MMGRHYDVAVDGFFGDQILENPLGVVGTAVAIEGEAELLAVFAAVDGSQLAAYEDAVSQEPLLEAPRAGSVVEERSIEAVGVVRWTFPSRALPCSSSTRNPPDSPDSSRTSSGVRSDSSYIHRLSNQP